MVAVIGKNQYPSDSAFRPRLSGNLYLQTERWLQRYPKKIRYNNWKRLTVGEIWRRVFVLTYGRVTYRSCVKCPKVTLWRSKLVEEKSIACEWRGNLKKFPLWWSSRPIGPYGIFYWKTYPLRTPNTRIPGKKQSCTYWSLASSIGCCGEMSSTRHLAVGITIRGTCRFH